MITTFDYVGDADLPGKQNEPPEREEVVDEDCGLCFRPGAEASGLCQHCADCLPHAGGCGTHPISVPVQPSPKMSDPALGPLVLQPQMGLARLVGSAWRR